MSLRIIFMGTPDFAVESLKMVVESGHNVVGVVTMPDKPAGRGQKIQFSPVKKYALSKKLPILQPKNLKDEQFVKELKALKADIQIVVAFRMLPEVVWNMPQYGTFNLHASLLPQYRGAAPINWAIINGEKETGVTTFFLTHKIDTGNIILQKKVDILDDENVGDVHDKLMVIGAELVIKTLDLIQKQKINTIEQSAFIDAETVLKDAPKLFKETCELNFDVDVEQAHNFVRGLSPYPVAWCKIQLPNQKKEILIKIFKTKIEKTEHHLPHGGVVVDKKSLKIALKNGFLSILELQIAGKKRMKVTDFLNGLHL